MYRCLKEIHKEGTEVHKVETKYFPPLTPLTWGELHLLKIS